MSPADKPGQAISRRRALGQICRLRSCLKLNICGRQHFHCCNDSTADGPSSVVQDTRELLAEQRELKFALQDAQQQAEDLKAASEESRMQAQAAAEEMRSRLQAASEALAAAEQREAQALTEVRCSAHPAGCMGNMLTIVAQLRSRSSPYSLPADKVRLCRIRDTAALWNWHLLPLSGPEPDGVSSGSIHLTSTRAPSDQCSVRCLQLPRSAAQTAVQQSWASSAL